MPVRIARGTLTLTVIALLAVVLAPASSGARGSSPVSTGRYVGKTSQGQTIKFRIVAAKCDSPRPPYAFHKAICFEGELSHRSVGAYYPQVLEPCSDATTYSDPLYVASYRLSLTAGGALSYRVRGLGSTLTQNGSLSAFSLQIRHGSARGTLRQTESYDVGNGPVSCDSKLVKFTAHRVG